MPCYHAMAHLQITKTAFSKERIEKQAYPEDVTVNLDRYHYLTFFCYFILEFVEKGGTRCYNLISW